MDRTVLPILKDVDACWQPTDFLPDSSSPDFVDEVRIFTLQAKAQACLLVCHS